MYTTHMCEQLWKYFITPAALYFILFFLNIFFCLVWSQKLKNTNFEEHHEMPSKNTNHHLLTEQRDGQSVGGGFSIMVHFFPNFACPADLTRGEYRDSPSLWNLSK